MELAKRNHYNPCFWTALWNRNYYEAFVSGSLGNLKARNQVVNSLNVKKDNIIETKVENVHYDKNLGFAEISFESAKAFCKRNHPDKYEDFCQSSTQDDYPVYIDFEDILTGIEQTLPYQILLSVIRHQRISSEEEKVFLASFVFLQLLRSHAIMNSSLEWNSQLGFDKFEYFIQLKWFLSDPKLLYPPVAHLALCLWVLYRTDKDNFPLNDSPVLVQPESILVALSPRLLLEIFPSSRAIGPGGVTLDQINDNKMVEFQKRTIGNTFREIILSDRSVLENWQKSDEFRKRVKDIKKMKSYNKLVSVKKDRELWLINALGNR